MAAFNWNDYSKIWRELNNWIIDAFPEATMITITLGADYNDQGYDLRVHECIVHTPKFNIQLKHEWEDRTVEDRIVIPYDLLDGLPYAILGESIEDEWERQFEFPIGKIPKNPPVLYVQDVVK